MVWSRFDSDERIFRRARVREEDEVSSVSEQFEVSVVMILKELSLLEVRHRTKGISLSSAMLLGRDADLGTRIPHIGDEERPDNEYK